MRVLHLETGRHLYGGARQVGYLIEGLTAHGVENVLVCAPGHALADPGCGARVLTQPCGGDFDWRYPGRLRRIIGAESPDIVHVHSRRGADVYGGRVARALGIPAVLTRRVESREPAFWARFKAGPYAAVVAISSAVHAELMRAGVAPDRLHVIPSAVDTTRFRPAPQARARLIDRYALPPDAVLAGCAAQLIARKGHDLLLPLAAGLAALEPRFRLLLFGRGPERKRLERRVRRSGLAQHVRFCGFEEDWPELLPGLDLLLHPARREGLGSVILEAMSAQVPVIASRAGGIVDVIDDGTVGRLLPADSPEVWSGVVLELVRDAAARARLGLAGRHRAEQEFTIAEMSRRYLEIYDRVRA